MSDLTDLALALDPYTSPPSSTGNISNNNDGAVVNTDTATTTVVVASVDFTAHPSNNEGLAILKQQFLDIYKSLCDQQSDLDDHLRNYADHVSSVLFKLACVHIFEKITSFGDKSLILRLIRCGERLIDSAISFARLTIRATEILPGSGSYDKEWYCQVIYNGLKYYCGQTMLLGAYLFWSTVFPGIKFSEQFVSTLTNIDHASKLYLKLFELFKIEDEVYGDDSLFAAASKTAFDNVIKKCGIIKKISHFVSEKEYLQQMCMEEDDDDDSAYDKDFKPCPKDLLDWVEDLKGAGEFSYTSIEHYLQMQDCFISHSK
ncbi:hypothetical protein H4219_003964 [Mycoemilia scoparia]|uniref:Uncharacterized protein n=1 Tax=Mycoemilia scoparia TaxID=417184 RepID=A0A9W8DM64_9FUNG|nr:hypothetical protein H4219_003964 [Mycoemilia scoparia]